MRQHGFHIAAVFLAASLLTATAPVFAQRLFADEQNDIFYGGTIGLGFGSVDYFLFSPMIGKHLSPQVSAGVSLLYRYRRDDRAQQELTTNDYGASVFARYRLAPTVFAHAEYEYLDYEFYRADLGKDRDDVDSLLLGGGVTQPAGRNASVYVNLLYNVLHDDDGPYDSPWVVRVGFGVGF